MMSARTMAMWSRRRHLAQPLLVARRPHQRVAPARQCSGTSCESAVCTTRPTARVLFRHFACCALPMVGFGFMDNTILIRAGDAIDNKFGASLGLESLQSAALGQVLSDSCGVLFGGLIESISRRFIVPPSLSSSQHMLRITQATGTAGAFVGVIVGCILGMGNFIFMDLKDANRIKQLEDMRVVVNRVVESARKKLDAGACTVFWVNHERQELWSFGSTGLLDVIRVPMTENSLCGWVAVNNKELVVEDAYKDARFGGRDMDRKTGIRTTSVLSIPVHKEDEPDKVIAVIQLLNKAGGFSALDVEMASMMASHAAVFLTDVLD